MDLSPVTLEGRFVRLEPLSRDHAPDLLRYALEPELWRFTATAVASADDFDRYIGTALQEQRAHTALPFATIDRATGRAIGSTRFANADHGNRRIEIGWTWLGTPFQRTAFNTDAKLLMLEHAFERLDCIRVELKTGHENARSRAAISRLGATQEGVLRHHMILANGKLRDSVYFSILREEWPSVRTNLSAKLDRSR